MSIINTGDYIKRFADSPPGQLGALLPWQLTAHAVDLVARLLDKLGSEYTVEAKIAIHSSAQVEQAAVLKGPAIVGPRCFIAAGAYVRGGCWLDEDCILGPGAELKSSFVFRGSKLAHFNFVGDSVLGERVNLEAGSIVANYRNERTDKAIWLRHDSTRYQTGVDKFGALMGDQCRIGANAVLAPGTLLTPGTVIARLALVDQDLPPLDGIAPERITPHSG
jgi:UDP-N-acetylglucosamine diphosphorylase / glucose-1-phosphate thymidylyltransferase / UDP-N-acetylgalactosamine diphosphorylase / glucosamine-1-phosphate N-acetyltransferase / galactosamine-1-phosphate N-acetyltransferase